MAWQTPHDEPGIGRGTLSPVGPMLPVLRDSSATLGSTTAKMWFAPVIGTALRSYWVGTMWHWTQASLWTLGEPEATPIAPLPSIISFIG